MRNTSIDMKANQKISSSILLCIWGVFCLLCGGAVIAQDVAVTVSIDAEQIVGEVSPYALGINHGPWSEVSLQMQDALGALELTFLRWPGGNWGDRYNITHSQIDLYMLQANQWTAVPSVHVRLEGGTPEQAAELVQYANVEKDYNIEYWYIGNEPNLFDDYDSQRFSAEWREFALAMRAVDPTIKLIGPEVSQFPDRESDDPNMAMRDDWIRTFLEVNGDLVDIVSVHRYPFPLSFAGDPTSVAQMRENVPRWHTVVSNLRSMIQETLGKDMPIAITEVNSHWSNSAGSIASPDSYYNAIWWSAVLTTLIHEDVDIVTYFILSSVGANGPFGILDRYEPRPTYYTYVLYAEIGSQLYSSESSDPYVTVLATERDDGSILVILTNLYEDQSTITLNLNGFDNRVLKTMRLLSEDNFAENVAISDYYSDDTVTMPAQSVITLTFE